MTHGVMVFWNYSGSFGVDLRPNTSQMTGKTMLFKVHFWPLMQNKIWTMRSPLNKCVSYESSLMAICYVNRLIKDLPVWRLTCWTNDINLSYLDWISRIGEMFWQMFTFKSLSSPTSSFTNIQKILHQHTFFTNIFHQHHYSRWNDFYVQSFPTILEWIVPVYDCKDEYFDISAMYEIY